MRFDGLAALIEIGRELLFAGLDDGVGEPEGFFVLALGVGFKGFGRGLEVAQFADGVLAALLERGLSTGFEGGAAGLVGGGQVLGGPLEVFVGAGGGGGKLGLGGGGGVA